MPLRHSTNTFNSRAYHPRAILFLTVLVSLLFLVCSPQVHAQGCAQCLDSTRATPPQVQAAYRHAILLMAGTGASLFVAGTLLLRNHR